MPGVRDCISLFPGGQGSEQHTRQKTGQKPTLRIAQCWTFGELAVISGFLLDRDPPRLTIQGPPLYLGYFLNPLGVVRQHGVYSWGAFLSTAPAPADDAHLVPPTARLCTADKRSPTVSLWAENTARY